MMGAAAVAVLILVPDFFFPIGFGFGLCGFIRVWLVLRLFFFG